MAEIIFGWVFIALAVAFLCAIAAAVVRYTLCFEYKDAYVPIYKAGLLGELVGLLIVIMLWLLYKHEPEQLDAEMVISIPFWTMIIGIIVGAIRLINKRKTEENN